MTTTLKVGPIEITSDMPKSTADFAALIDAVTVRLQAVVTLALALQTGQALVAATPATAPASSAPATTVGTVNAV